MEDGDVIMRTKPVSIFGISGLKASTSTFPWPLQITIPEIDLLKDVKLPKELGKDVLVKQRPQSAKRLPKQ